MPRPRKKMAPAAQVPRSRYHVEALARGLQILSAFSADRAGLTIKEIADSTGHLPSTIFRVVMTLVDLGYLAADKKGAGYSLTANPVLLGYSALAGLTLEELAAPALQRLHRETEESVFLSVLVGDQAVDIVSLRRPGLLSTLGQRFPLYCTAGGKVLLAFLPDKQASSMINRLELLPLAPHTVTTRDGLGAEIEKVRKEGYSLVDQELVPGTYGVGAPVFDAEGMCIASVVITAAMNRISFDQLAGELVPGVRRTADEITQRVRWRQIPPNLVAE